MPGWGRHRLFSNRLIIILIYIMSNGFERMNVVTPHRLTTRGFPPTRNTSITRPHDFVFLASVHPRCSLRFGRFLINRRLRRVTPASFGSCLSTFAGVSELPTALGVLICAPAHKSPYYTSAFFKLQVFFQKNTRSRGNFVVYVFIVFSPVNS